MATSCGSLCGGSCRRAAAVSGRRLRGWIAPVVIALYAWPAAGQVRVDGGDRAFDVTSGALGLDPTSTPGATLFGRIDPSSPFGRSGLTTNGLSLRNGSSPTGTLGTGVPRGDIVGPIGADLFNLRGVRPTHLSNSLFNDLTATGAAGGRLPSEFTYDEEELFGATPLFGPSAWRVPAITKPARLPGLTSQAPHLVTGGRISTNFGLSPWSGVTRMARTSLATPAPSWTAADAMLPQPQGPPTPLRPDAIETPREAHNTRQGRATEPTTGLAVTGGPSHATDPTQRQAVVNAVVPDATDAIPGVPRTIGGVSRTAPNAVVHRRTEWPLTPETNTSDVLARMKTVVARLRKLRDDQRSLADTARKVPSLTESYERVLSFVRDASADAVTSFSSPGGGPSEAYARSAEAALKTGEFSRAVTQYRIAQAADPDNALLYLGEGHALIGAGEYFTAVRKIERGIARFPEIAYFKLDLNAFVPNAEMLDIRRADLETRLARREDYRLRFLLGYIEYYSGFEAFGLENLKRAAADAPAGSAIARFPQLLLVGRSLLDQVRSEPTGP